MSSYLGRHPRLRARLALAGRLATLLGTSYFLIATSQTLPDEREPGDMCKHRDLEIAYQVTGSCGPAGQVVLISPAAECAISLQGAGELGLPSAGRFESNKEEDSKPSKGQWTLAGYLPEGAATSLPAGDAGPFTVRPGPGLNLAGDPVPHGMLVVRRCQAQAGSGDTIVIECRDAPADCGAGSVGCGGSITACTAILKER